MDLRARFVSRLTPAQAEALAGHEDALAEHLADHCRAAREAHPGLATGDDALIDALAARLPAGGDLAGLRALRAADVYLAIAAAAGDPAAIARLEPILSVEVDKAGAGLRAAATVVDEVKQRLRARLLVGDGERGPALADFAGFGDLRGFLHISGARECLRVIKAQAREVGADGDELAALASAVDPELDRLKTTYRQQFTECFVLALEALEPRERTLLRHHAIDRLGIDRIGALYGVHRATAARWLERARAKIAERTEELLAERLSLDSVEAASVIRLVRSQLDVSLERLLRG